ncbi:Sterol desaturase/sphingolipid hydroxylase, fatty acid hydroxylase superfamily [Catalinimonas alkaloidigena]|uniref:Sterol desaturase/sphingolipid hydroxylase, fatty acid hydroxylase superfamily n=1 Tax=Catalinimonas alkaloidigena TaxID=1075417 RepID=A0A1G9JA06_9BACT|nr:sterol desaturase family protein [Catalinimonas alkaloidigena]SDL34036.1 Sterol desaturase/sphingolipid hydroxylase, fatty acid hydroxylase superfamily [Catalinimonas alkaloidigena]
MSMDLPPLINYAVPFMLALVLLEFVISQYENRELYVGKDFLASAGIGIGNLVVSAVVKAGLLAIILFFYNLVPWTVPPTWWSFVLCYVVFDFFQYWAHRVAHERRILWATHVTHHSSEQYNFSVSFRLSWTQHIKVVFFIPVALIAFDPVVFFICYQIAVLYQFWIHTELIGKLPAPIEYFFVTPSHHRVHHGSDPKYLDKNYGASFIIWDRLFGTFQPEEEQPTYGITTPVNSYNPVYLVFHEWSDIFRDLKGARSLKEAYAVLWSGPGKYNKADFQAVANTSVVATTDEELGELVEEKEGNEMMSLPRSA